MNTIMRMRKIEDVVEETQNMKSFWFTDTAIAQADPGQFVMLWVPHVSAHKIDFTIPDQIPMSVSRTEGERFSITVQACGDTTRELFTYERGDRVGITGPLGHGFTVTGSRILCVAGGIGAAPLLLLVQRLGEVQVHFILGAQTETDLLFRDTLESHCISLLVTTDDGSSGKKGFASDPVKEVCTTYDIDHIYSCGPEPMMYKILQMSCALDIPAQFSLERYMYCGIGLCGHCSLDHYLVCKDGPVFTSEQLQAIEDFGMKKVDETGRKIPFSG
jgi:dihydroorotate dehydrogenase electron transfer subunit